MINRGGPTLVVRIADQTGAAPARDRAPPSRRCATATTCRRSTSEIDALDNKIAGRRCSSTLYAAVQDLLLDRLVWFLRNVDLTQGSCRRRRALPRRYRAGRGCARRGAVTQDRRGARAARVKELAEAGAPQDAGASDRRAFPSIAAAPDIVLIADRTGSGSRRGGGDLFRGRGVLPARSRRGAARGIVVSDYFDRLALDRALDSIGDAERRLTAAMVGNGEVGEAAVEAWVKPRQAEVERIRAAIHEIAGSGLTLSKLSVAASLLGDLARQ